MNTDCQGCGREDCEPRYHEDTDSMFCDYCYSRADIKYLGFDDDDDMYLWDERDE